MQQQHQYQPAFATPLPISRRTHTSTLTSPAHPVDRCVRRARHPPPRPPPPFPPNRVHPHPPTTTTTTETVVAVADQTSDDDLRPRSRPQPQPQPPLFLDDSAERFWQGSDASSAFAPLSAEEETILRAKLPRGFAQFLIDRAGDAARLRQPRTPNDQSFIGRILSDLPPDTPDWEDVSNAEYKDYVYVTTTGPPSRMFRPKSSALFGGGDGLPNEVDGLGEGVIGNAYVDENGQQIIRPYNNPDDPTNTSSQPRVVSLFVGQTDSIDEQASRLGYGILAILAVFVILKLIFAVISFFLSFTFSFFAIFALSAGLFVLFFFIRF